MLDESHTHKPCVSYRTWPVPASRIPTPQGFANSLMRGNSEPKLFSIKYLYKNNSYSISHFPQGFTIAPAGDSL